MGTLVAVISFLTVILSICSEKLPEKSEAINLVAEFVQYKTFFREVNNNHVKCFADDIFNSTHSEFMRSLERCSNEKYRPRCLSTSQISWKSAPPKPEDNKIPYDKSKRITADEKDSNNTTPISDAAVEKETKDIINKYLAFALLLPEHPFSSDLLSSLTAIGPMFPSVTIVTGDGYDFKEMCAQYNVQSFPKLIFFRDGLLNGTYDGAYSVPLLASTLARWTQSLPKSLPGSTRIFNLIKKSKTKNYFTWEPRSLIFSTFFFGIPISAHVPYSTEPIMGTIESLVPYDWFIFLLSGLFVFSRFGYFLWSRWYGQKLE